MYQLTDILRLRQGAWYLPQSKPEGRVPQAVWGTLRHKYGLHSAGAPRFRELEPLERLVASSLINEAEACLRRSVRQQKKGAQR